MGSGIAGTRIRKAAFVGLGGFAAALSFSAVSRTHALLQFNSEGDSASAAINPALCPVVYPDDPTPASRGYRYTFFGNAFFINEQGYLLTVAHVLETFRDGGQPYILVNRPDAPPRLLKVTVIAEDLQHDVAILRAAPNPFAGKYTVAVLPLDSEPTFRGEAVLALSLHPKRLQDAQSFEYEREDASAGTVLSYESTKLANAGAPSEVFLLSHPVEKGQSGSPVLALKSRAAVGLVEGLWLRGISFSSAKPDALPANTPGAAIPVRYAIALLRQHGIAWHPVKTSSPQLSRTTLSQSTENRPKQ